MSTAPDVVRRYFAAINGEDWSALAEVYADEAVVSPAGEDPIEGSEAIVAWYQRTFRRFPEHHDEPTRAIVAADGMSAAVEITFTGRTRQDKAFEFQAVDLFDLVGDASGGAGGRQQILRMRSWFDTAALFARLRG